MYRWKQVDHDAPPSVVFEKCAALSAGIALRGAYHGHVVEFLAVRGGLVTPCCAVVGQAGGLSRQTPTTLVVNGAFGD